MAVRTAASNDTSSFRQGAWWLLLMYAGTVAVFLYSISRSYDPATGFTSLIHFGQRFERRSLQVLKDTPHFVYKDTAGHDGQHYAQLALEPFLRDPAIDRALDNIQYRARRILFSWTAWALGLGHPWWILQIYALQNVISWLLLAVLLLHWLPFGTIRAYVLWAAILLSYGITFSAQYALLDGPSMLLIATGVWLLDKRRDLAASLILGISGLAKETNILGAAILPRRGDVATSRDAAMLVVRLALAALPLVLWLGYLRAVYGWSFAGTSTGSGNLSLPFVTFFRVWRESLHALSFGMTWAVFLDLASLLGLTLPLVLLAWRRDWNDPWWRIGIAFGALLVCLGRSPWDMAFTDVTRLVIPLTVAFNVRLFGEREFWPWFLLGNLSLIRGIDMLRLPFLSGS